MKLLFKALKISGFNYALSLLAMIVCIHLLYVVREVDFIHQLAKNTAAKNLAQFEGAIENKNIFNLKNTLSIIKGEQISFLTYIAANEGEKWPFKLFLGDVNFSNNWKIKQFIQLRYNGRDLGLIYYEIDLIKMVIHLLLKNGVVYALFLLFTLGILITSHSGLYKMLHNLEENFIRIGKIPSNSDFENSQKILEIQLEDLQKMGISQVYTDVLLKLLEAIKNIIEYEKTISLGKVTNEIAKQVSHDIRSPLAALNMATASLETLPENERILIRNAVLRINDIANDLLQKGKQENLSSTSIPLLPENDNKVVELIPALIDILVSEKRMQYREYSGINIELELKDSFGAFSFINSRELKRAISNMVNNSVEAFENHIGKIKIIVQDNNQHVEILIIDNGKGIPTNLLTTLGREQVSYGKTNSKNSGSGIGLYHARRTIEQMDGKFEITSTLGLGTTIQIKLNLADAPRWFAANIDLTGKSIIVSLDDDLSVHQIWANRFLFLNEHDISHKQFHSGEVFMNFVKETYKDLEQVQFLIDYELLNQTMTGLDIIEHLKIAKNSILVTSRYEDKNIRDRANAINLKILPKSLAAQVPIKTQELKQKYDIILIDDDALVRMTWEMKARQKGKSIKTFETSASFWAQINAINPESALYIDVHLVISPGVNESGVDLSQKLYQLGFSNLYLATGYEADEFSHVTWVKGVVGKNPII